MAGTLAKTSMTCEHPSDFGYFITPELELRGALRHRHDSLRYDRHINSAHCLAVLWLMRHRETDPLANLESAARTKNQIAFVGSVKEIDWQQRSVRDFVRAIQLALKVGAHLTARELAGEGAELHFDSDDLEKYSRVLAPPRVLTGRPQSTVDPKANVEWLNANKANYKGSWVAIKNGEFLGSANSYKELSDRLGNTKGRGILVTPIY